LVTSGKTSFRYFAKYDHISLNLAKFAKFAGVEYFAKFERSNSKFALIFLNLAKFHHTFYKQLPKVCQYFPNIPKFQAFDTLVPFSFNSVLHK